MRHKDCIVHPPGLGLLEEELKKELLYLEKNHAISSIAPKEYQEYMEYLTLLIKKQYPH